jgi:hypothetical protein
MAGGQTLVGRLAAFDDKARFRGHSIVEAPFRAEDYLSGDHLATTIMQESINGGPRWHYVGLSE